MSKRNEYQYGVSGGEPYYSVRCIWDADDLDEIAEEAAEDYFSEHDGWESSWPLRFSIFKDGKKLGDRSVDMEAVPKFYAVIS